MKKVVVYIHGKGGNAEEAQRYKSLFPDADVIGFDYLSKTPWEAKNEFYAYFGELRTKYDSVCIIANSIGAYFALNALYQVPIEKAYFISPVVDMESLITNMMQWAGVSERELESKGKIETAFGETLSFEYLTWVREHPILWKIPTAILYGEKDNLQSFETVKAFSVATKSSLTVMKGGEHWFHTEKQMKFLDEWIVRAF